MISTAEFGEKSQNTLLGVCLTTIEHQIVRIKVQFSELKYQMINVWMYKSIFVAIF